VPGQSHSVLGLLGSAPGQNFRGWGVGRVAVKGDAAGRIPGGLWTKGHGERDSLSGWHRNREGDSAERVSLTVPGGGSHRNIGTTRSQRARLGGVAAYGHVPKIHGSWRDCELSGTGSATPASRSLFRGGGNALAADKRKHHRQSQKASERAQPEWSGFILHLTIIRTDLGVRLEVPQA